MCTFRLEIVATSRLESSDIIINSRCVECFHTIFRDQRIDPKTGTCTLTLSWGIVTLIVWPHSLHTHITKDCPDCRSQPIRHDRFCVKRAELKIRVCNRFCIVRESIRTTCVHDTFRIYIRKCNRITRGFSVSLHTFILTLLNWWRGNVSVRVYSNVVFEFSIRIWVVPLRVLYEWVFFVFSSSFWWNKSVWVKWVSDRWTLLTLQHMYLWILKYSSIERHSTPRASHKSLVEMDPSYLELQSLWCSWCNNQQLTVISRKAKVRTCVR